MKNTVCANDITIHGKALFGITIAVINYIHMPLQCNLTCSCEFIFLLLVGLLFLDTA